MRLLEDIIAKELLDSNANIVGKVKDVEIDASTKKIKSIILIEKDGKGGFFNKKTTEKIIPFENIASVGDKIILSKSFDEIVDDVIDMD
ncbi:MAG: hypothetical protein BZ136_07185 [Methanosphaera sp. rholeuAM74]|nr:MAG: hypothetical protein BZ136_07185 [Methanosphaera sp. rholeuAM74]